MKNIIEYYYNIKIDKLSQEEEKLFINIKQ